MIYITLPFPPSTNTYYRKVNNRMLISKKGREYAKMVAAIRMTKFPNLKPLEGRLAIGIHLFLPDKRRRDIDNFGGKAILDAMMKAGFYKDDSQIVKLYVEKLSVLPPGEANITILEI